MRTGYRQFFRAGCLYLLVLVTCCKALEAFPPVMTRQWHTAFFSADPDLVPVPVPQHSSNEEVAAMVRQNRQVSWYRFLVWLGIIEALPGEEPGSSGRGFGAPASRYVVPGILETPVTSRPRYRYSPRSRATALKSTHPYPWYLHSYRYHKPFTEKPGEAGQRESGPAKSNETKKGLKDWAGRMEQMQKLKKKVKQGQGSWRLVKNFEKELTDNWQLILKNALIYFGNALEQINQNTGYPVPETVADFEQQLTLVDPYLALYTYSMVRIFINIASQSKRPEINRWRHSARYLMHYVMADYNWPVELLEEWIGQTEPGLTSGIVTLNMPAADYPYWTREFCQWLGDYSPALLETAPDKYDQYSFLPSVIASLELRRFIDTFTRFPPGILRRTSRLGDVLVIRSFQVLMMLMLDTNGTMNSQEQAFIHAWLRLRELEGKFFTGWNTLFGMIGQADSEPNDDEPVALIVLIQQAGLTKRSEALTNTEQSTLQ